MYNRYIPQPDGSYRRNRLPDGIRQNPPPISHRPPVIPPEAPQECPPPKQEHRPHPKQNSCPRNKQDKPATGGSVSGFLRQLLPKDFDTGDLLIILLLLLMAGDCAEDQNTAILTLALYLFM